MGSDGPLMMAIEAGTFNDWGLPSVVPMLVGWGKGMEVMREKWTKLGNVVGVKMGSLG